MLSVELRVAHVVRQVAGARRSAVGGEADTGFHPPVPVADLGREDDAGEDEEGLRPLPGPHRGERRAYLAAPNRNLEGVGDRHAPRMLSAGALDRGGSGQRELEAAAPARGRVDLDPAAERLRELARDREP